MKQIKLKIQVAAIFFAFFLFSCGNKTASNVKINFVDLYEEKYTKTDFEYFSENDTIRTPILSVKKIK